MTKHVVHMQEPPKEDGQFVMVYLHDGVPWAVTFLREGDDLSMYDPMVGWLEVTLEQFETMNAVYITHLYDMDEGGMSSELH